MRNAARDARQSGRADLAAWPERMAAWAATSLVAGWLRIAPWAGPLLVVLVLGLILAFEALRPQFNWDMIAYLASAMHAEGQDFAPIHAAVYEALRQAAPEAAFRELTEGDAYRLRQFTDPAALQSMLAMYEVKWLYVTLLAVAIPVFGMAGAGFAINAAAAVLFSVSAWAWMSRHRLQMHAPLLAALFVGLGLPDMLRGTGSDFLTSALLMSGLMFWDRGRVTGATLAMTLAVLTRPDTAIFLGGLCVLLAMFRPQDALKAAMVLGFSAAAYLFATSTGHHIGWWPHLWFSTYHIQETLEGFAPAFSAKVYLTAVGYNVGRSLVEAAWPAFWLGGLVLAAYGFSRRELFASGVPFRLVVLLAAVAATVGKFMLFPLPENRLYAPHLFPALLLGGAWLLAHAGAVSLSGHRKD